MLHQIVRDRFKERGWTVLENPAIASRMFATAVGEKEALVYLVQWTDYHSLRGDYYSEGRNILEPDSVLVEPNSSRETVISRVDQFIAGAEKTISESYAVRLLRPTA